MPYAVPFGDVDSAGVLYYPRYFHAFHVAFERWWEEGAGRPYHLILYQDKVAFPTVHIECDFRRRVEFGDPMEIRVGVRRIGNRSVVFRYEVVHRETGDVHAAADITKAVVETDTFKPIPPPGHIRRMLEEILEV